MVIKPNSTELNELSIESLLKEELSTTELELDLKDILFVLPYGLILLIIFLNDLRNRNIKIKILLPTSADVLNYLERIHFFTQIADLAVLDSDVSYLRSNIENPTYSLKEITRITEQENLMTIVNKMADHLINKFSFGKEKINKFSEIMVETFQNIPEHSNPLAVSYNGIVSAQIFKDYFHFALGDSGIGIKNSLCLNPRYKELKMNDCEAIENVLFKGWSRHLKVNPNSIAKARLFSIVP